MSIRLWPQDFDRKDHISKSEKFLLRNAARNFTSGHFAVGIDPVGMSTPDVRMGMYISPSEGLITFSIFQGELETQKLDTYINYVNIIEEKILERMLDSKALIIRNNNNKILKFPYKHLIMFTEAKVGSINLSEDKLKKINPYITQDFFRPLTSKGKEKRVSELSIFSNIRIPYDNSFSGMSDLECRAIFERLAPEYTVIINEVENIHIKENKGMYSTKEVKITGEEVEFKTFFLDEYQVALVNDMGKGHRVILANPGAGKSVLLLSKAYKYASTYKESKILLTCYNNNLADAYNFKLSCANFGDNNNLFVMTFHKLVKKIYEECLGSRCESNIATDDEIRKCIELVKAGKISLCFKAIFIDEVQNFNPLYLELCYLLLEPGDDYVYLMAGDLNQSIRSKSRKGDAAWKKINGAKLDFSGRVKYIEKNYRNSKAIGEYLRGMLSLMNNRFEMLDLINPMEYEYNSFMLSDNPTLALKIDTGIDRKNIKNRVIESIEEIAEKYKISYSDIAVLFPYRKHAMYRYYIHHWVEQGLDERNIPHSSIISSGTWSNNKVRYSDTSGVVLSTIESSLGLDFKAVILAGLLPYGYVFTETGKSRTVSSWSDLKAMSEEEQVNFQNQMRAIYTACSRARDVLYVLSDLKPGTPMEEILKNKGVYHEQ